MEKICKIVYFDEESVTDYVQIVAGGELENTTALAKNIGVDNCIVRADDYGVLLISFDIPPFLKNFPKGIKRIKKRS